MKLKYKILWIEDELDSIERPKSQIQKYLEDDYGYECKDEDIVIKDYDEFEEEYVYEEHGRKRVNDSIKDFDLLLVDFNLGEEEQTGDKLIEVIREGIYSEILFYSSELESINEKLNNHFIDGVFTSDREHLEDKIKKLIRVTIKKVQDVNNLRGLIMAEVAELERIKERIIIKASPKISEKNIEKYVLKKIKSSGTSTKNKAEKLLSDIDTVLFEDLFNDTGFIDLDKKLHATGEILEKLGITTPISKNELIEPYKKDIRDIRNKFAHVEECDGIDEYGVACKVIKDIPFTEKNCINIRKQIKKYKEILKQIEQNLDE